MARRVPFFDLEYALSRSLYVHEPRASYASFEDEPGSCATYYQALMERRFGAKTCAKRCKVCQHVAHMNDYIRGFHQKDGKRTEAKPHYPLPVKV